MVVSSHSGVVRLMNEMFDVMYQCSTPSISWYEILDLVDSGVCYSYANNFLDADECEGIYEEYLSRVAPFYRSSFGWMFLNYSPSCSRSRVLSGV